MFNRIIRTSALLLCACVAAPALAQTTNRLDEILARGTLRVGSTGDYKPFSFKNPTDGRFIGLDVEMGERLAKALGVKLEVVPTTWSTLMRDFGDNRFDIAMSGISVTLERQKKAFYSVPYQRDGKTPITRCENQAKYQTLAQIDQPNVLTVVNPGGTNEKFAREHLKQAQIRVYPDNVTIFDEIIDGRADLMMRRASGRAVRFLGEGLPAAARRGVQELRRSVAAADHGKR
jgi:cyclohexadienyl dehydratase